MIHHRGDLSLRERDSGGGLRKDVDAAPVVGPQGVLRSVLLVHGYNVNRRSAESAYGKLLGHLSERFPPTWRVFWPGNRWGLLGFASYPLEVHRAKESAARLADYLRGLRGPGGGRSEIAIVAHSLGCRVVLEALEILARNRHDLQPRVTFLCLMAAAVPVEMLYPDDQLRRGFYLSERRLVLHKEGDAVLGLAFPVGQALAYRRRIEPRVYRHAVGLRGEPLEAVGERCPMGGMQHGAYWNDTKTADMISLAMGTVVRRSPPQRRRPARWRASRNPTTGAVE